MEEKTLIFNWFYILGCILAYILGKYFRDKKLKHDGHELNWGHILVNIFISIFSWVGVFMILIFGVIMWLDKTKPPKWL